MNPSKMLKKHPALFDSVKRFSRRIGRTNPLYDKLASEAALRSPLRFIQIGANDGISCDPIREFIVRYSWTGLVVEPIPQVFELLKRSYMEQPIVTPVNCAITYGQQQESLKLYAVSTSALKRFPAHASMISSSNKNHLSQILPALRDDEISELVIRATTIEQLLDEYKFCDIDFLHLDVEGHEANILLNLDFERINPQFVLFESIHLLEAERSLIEERLIKKGFVCSTYGADTFAHKCRL